MSTNSRRTRTTRIHDQNMRPVPKAVRGVLAVSASALAMTMLSGPADASTPPFCVPTGVPGGQVQISCDGFNWTDTIDGFAVEDLTLVVGGNSAVSITPATGDPGIIADWSGDVTLFTQAEIETSYAPAIVGAATSGDLLIENRGSAFSEYDSAIAASSNDAISIVNRGELASYSLGDPFDARDPYAEATNYYGNDLDSRVQVVTVDAYGDGNVGVLNDTNGSIVASSMYNDWDTYYSYESGYTVDQTNARATGVRARSYYGDVVVNNRGSILAGTLEGDGAIGIDADTNLGPDSSVGDITIVNSGSIQADTLVGEYAIGVRADGGSVYVQNAEGGEILASAAQNQGSASGIIAFGESYVGIDNAGLISVEGDGGSGGPFGDTTGVGAIAFYGEAVVHNSGDIEVSSHYGDASGVSAFGYFADVSVHNAASGLISVTAGSSADGSKYSEDAVGINVYTIGGGVGAAIGAPAVFSYGDIYVRNDGIVDATAADDAYGVRAASKYGDVDVVNGAIYDEAGAVVSSGTITATSTSQDAVGIYADTYFGDVTITNSGAVVANAQGYAAGVFAGSVAGDISINNTANGSSSATSDDEAAWGLLARATSGDIAVQNAGSLDATGYYTAAGIEATTGAGDIYVANTETGVISANQTGWDLGDPDYGAYGIAAESYTTGDVTVFNAGSIAVTAEYNAQGILAAADGTGDVYVGHSGSISARANDGTAAGIYASSGTGDVTVVSSGSIDSYSRFAGAYGIYAYTSSGDTYAANSGGITVESAFDATGINAGADGGVEVGNTAAGSIGVTSHDGDAWGVFASGAGSDVTVWNRGAITVGADGAESSGTAYGIDAENDYGDVTVVNLLTTDAETGELLATGTIDVTSTGGDAYGIDASVVNGGGVYVLNEGDITVAAASDYYAYAYATGINAWADDYAGDVLNIGTVHVVNAGNVDVSGGYDVWGVYASTQRGDVMVVNTADGVISLNSGDDAYGIDAGSTQGGDVTVVNYGTLDIQGGEDAYGVTAWAEDDGDARIYNMGDVTVNAADGDAAGLAAYTSYGTYGDALVVNYASGEVSVTASESAAGLVASAGAYYGYGYGDAVAVNFGDVTVSATYDAVGATASSEYGMAGVFNGGNLSATAEYGDATGASADSSSGDAVVYNAGSITAHSTEGDATGISAVSTYGDVAVYSVSEDDPAAPSVTAHSVYGNATGIDAESDFADVLVVSSGSITADAAGRAAGILAYSGAKYYGYGIYSGNVDVYNSATIAATSSAYDAVGIDASVYGDGHVMVTNLGDITATAARDAFGVTADSKYGDVTVLNGGDIAAVASAEGSTVAYGISAMSLLGDAYVAVDTGASVTASATSAAGYATAVGVQAAGYFDVEVVNGGDITATAAADGEGGIAGAVGVTVSSNVGDVTVANYGHISATATGDNASAIAVNVSSHYGSYVYNAVGATIAASGGNGGSVAVRSTGGSADEIVNLGTVTGSVVTGDGDDSLFNQGTWNALETSDFGTGDDTITNAVGGLIVVDNSSIVLGDWNDAAPTKSGGLQAPAPTGNVFVNAGTLRVRGDSVIDMGDANPNPFVNTGVIDFHDGQPDDTLTIHGDLSGDGSLVVDMRALNGATDVLYVDGNVVDGTQMTIDGHLDAMPTSATTSIDVLKVSGDSASGQIVVGDITVATDSFTTFSFGVDETIDATNTDADLHSLVIQVTGLSAYGDALASLAPAIQNYFHDTLGSLTRRTGVAEDQELGVPTAWVRYTQTDEKVDPDTNRRDFGSGGDGRFDQNNSAYEFGLDVRVADDLRLGLLVGKGDASVHMNGAGNAKLDADHYGAYVTWLANCGFYLDANYRKMNFDSHVNVGSNRATPDAKAKGYSLEAGYAWKLDGGTVVKPELQYSKMKVDSLDAVTDTYGQFQLKDGDSTRLRAGVSVQRMFGEKGRTWTPYLGAYYVDEMDGKGTYEINGNFRGDVDMGGNSTLVEGGITGQVGRWVLSGGLNWQDGDTLNNAIGGQVSVRYSF